LKRDPVILIVLAMVASALLVFGFISVINGHGLSPEELAALKMKGQMAHDFALSTTDGKTLRLSELRGHAVVLNFWATTCGPCKVEMPWFAELQKQYGPQGLQILGMDINDDAPVQDVTSFAKDMGVDYPILVAKRSDQVIIGNDYGGIAFLPETFYIGRDGKVAEKTIGLKSRSAIEESIQNALAQGPIGVAQRPSDLTHLHGTNSALKLRSE
jgi:thiol-disulfide isomerase/thioredoxin